RLSSMILRIFLSLSLLLLSLADRCEVVKEFHCKNVYATKAELQECKDKGLHIGCLYDYHFAEEYGHPRNARLDYHGKRTHVFNETDDRCLNLNCYGAQVFCTKYDCEVDVFAAAIQCGIFESLLICGGKAWKQIDNKRYCRV
ncbi:hypothetical protein PMAYCL1PPCAC_19318, partial [Pristionchus mayeri]